MPVTAGRSALHRGGDARMRRENTVSDPSVQFDRRLVDRLVDCWRRAHADTAAPTLDAFYALELDDMVAHLVLIELQKNGCAPVFRMIGPAYRREWIADATGCPTTAVPPDTLLGRAVQHWREALARAVPVAGGGGFTDLQGQNVLYRSIILPLCEDGRRITHLLCAASGARTKRTSAGADVRAGSARAG